MGWIAQRCIVVLLGVCACMAPVAADQRMTAKVNRGTVTIVTGGINGTYAQIAADLSSVLDGDDVRVLTMLGKGSLKNVEDLLYLNGIDLAIVQSDVLGYLKRNNTYPAIERELRYVTKLYNEEFHLLALREVQSVEDLAGKTVNIDGRGSGTAITATTVFDAIGVDIVPAYDDQAAALEKLKRGSIDALVYVAGKPTRLFRELAAVDGTVHFVPVAITPELLQTYLPTHLSNEDYPALIGPDEAIETLAVGAVLATYNWRQTNSRYLDVARLVDKFFDRFDALLEPPWHPKWREVSLSAVVPGWTRFGAAADWLKRHQSPE